MRISLLKIMAGEFDIGAPAPVSPSIIIPGENAFYKTFLIQNANKDESDVEALAIIKQVLVLHDDEVPDDVHFTNLQVLHDGAITDIASTIQYDRYEYDCNNEEELLPIFDQFLGFVPLIEVKSFLDNQEFYLRCMPGKVLYNGDPYAQGNVRIMMSSLVERSRKYFPVHVRVSIQKFRPEIRYSSFVHALRNARHSYSFNEGVASFTQFSGWLKRYSFRHVALTSANKEGLCVVYHRKDDLSVTLRIDRTDKKIIKGYTPLPFRTLPDDRSRPE